MLFVGFVARPGNGGRQMGWVVPGELFKKPATNDLALAPK
ncbi:hypothetical protein M23134_08460 [Microscilla marina ATCC 23134]|uniref:Uncharacterized protein n=1 Tax=Microscilla marina ATCC 23134 TaxID=313606 RepID=A1ZR93_MICM2|nr:hypothetical protein M23134_08456 [Microscilla marina ATCC 23134]EAY27186.1 hypothetical protein M23134_08460 [Microscilla marina ATCC 23134]